MTERLDVPGTDFRFFASEILGRELMKPYPLVDDLLPPILRVAMPRAGRLYAPGGTVHVVARCNNREFCFTRSEDSEPRAGGPRRGSCHVSLAEL